MTLYDIDQQVAAALADCDGDGLLHPDAEARLDVLEVDRAAVLANIARKLANLEGERLAYRDEIDRLSNEAAARTTAIDRLKEYLRGWMVTNDVYSLQAGLWKLRVQKNSTPTVRLRDGHQPRELPERYQRVTVELNKTQIVADWRSGDNPLPPEVSVEVGTHLRIT